MMVLRATESGRQETVGHQQHTLSVLVLCDNSRTHASNLREHLDALAGYSRHRVRLYNAKGVPRSRFLDLDAFDVVVIHYSLVITSDNYLAPWLRERIREFEGLKVQFLQDEYRWVDAVTAMMRWLGIDVLFSIVPRASLPALYEGRLDGVEIIPTLAGFVPEKPPPVRRLPPLSRRPIDVGYRGRVLPYWIGALSQEKIAIAKGFLARASAYGLECDIAWSEADRIYGDAWTRFLSSCRTTLGTESGSSLTDFDGSVERATLVYLEDHPDAAFEEVFDAVLAPYEGNVMMNVISPRVFEAAALHTGLVLFPGEYGGVLEPERHYIALEKDFSNMDAVAAAIRDDRLLERMTQQAYEDLIASGRYSLRTFVEQFDEAIAARGERRAKVPQRSLLAARLERPVITRSVFGIDVHQSRQEFQRCLLTIRLVRELPALRGLAIAYLRDAGMRRKFGMQRAHEDFLRLGLLLREQQDLPLSYQPFYVVPSFEEPGTLTLAARERVPDEAPAAGVDTAAALELLRGSDPPTILWNHTALGALVSLSRSRRTGVGLQVGYYRLLGVYHFGVIEALARRHRELVLEALRPLLEPAVHDTDPAALWQGPGAAERGNRRHVVLLLALRALRSARPLVALYGRSSEFRRAVPPRALVSDLARLRALHDAWGGRVGAAAGIDAERRGDELRFTTRTKDVLYHQSWGDLQFECLPTSVTWDNGAAGPTLGVREGQLRIGQHGRHSFRAVEAAFAIAPEHAWSAIIPRESRRRLLDRRALRLAVLVARTATERRGRRVIARSIALRKRVSLKPLLADLVKLRALEELLARGAPVGREVTGGIVTFVSGSFALDPLPDRPEQLLWDHGQVGPTVDHGGVTFTLGSCGTYEFRAIATVLRHASRAAWQAVLPAAPAGSPHPTGMPRKEHQT
jgi:hypothetical protein